MKKTISSIWIRSTFWYTFRKR